MSAPQIMLDVETWGTRPGCALRSVGLVRFTFDGALEKACYWNLDVGSQTAVRLYLDASTQEYWRRQPEAAQQVFVKDQQPLEQVMMALSAEITDRRSTLWAYGSEFDFPILTAAYAAAGMSTPWKSPQIRDSRTVLELFGFDARSVPPPREPRTAATRALFQAQCLVTCLRQREAAPAKPKNVFGD